MPEEKIIVLPKAEGFPKNFSEKFRFKDFRSEAKSVIAKIVALDGSGDFDNIQAAIDSLPSEGGTVFIKPGSYNITSPITISKYYIKLIGSGFQNTSIITSTDINIIELSSAFFIEISSMQLQGSGSGNTSNSGLSIPVNSGFVILRDCYIDNCGLHGIYAEGSSNIFSNIHIADNYGHGILISGSSSNFISSCFITGNDKGNTITYDGIHIGIRPGVGSSLNIISSCIISNNDNFQIVIDNSLCTRNSIINNQLYIPTPNQEGTILDQGANTEIAHNHTF